MARFPSNWTESTPGTNHRTTIGIGLVELSGCSFVQSPGNRRKYRLWGEIIGILACFSLTVEEIAERKSRTRKTVILPKGRFFHLGNNERCAYSISFLCLHFRVPRS